MANDDLAAVVGSRLCHDLVSPLGAIGNGVELLRMIHAPSEELEMVEDAVRVAQARVKLFRMAFGNARDDQQIRATEIAEALSGLSTGGRVRVRTALPAPLPRPQVKRLMLASLCLETALAFGGDIAVGPDCVSAHAPRLNLDPDLWEPLAAGREPRATSAACVQFALLARTGAIRIEDGTDGLTIRV